MATLRETYEKQTYEELVAKRNALADEYNAGGNALIIAHIKLLDDIIKTKTPIAVQRVPKPVVAPTTPTPTPTKPEPAYNPYSRSYEEPAPSNLPPIPTSVEPPAIQYQAASTPPASEEEKPSLLLPLVIGGIPAVILAITSK